MASPFNSVLIVVGSLVILGGSWYFSLYVDFEQFFNCLPPKSDPSGAIAIDPHPCWADYFQPFMFYRITLPAIVMQSLGALLIILAIFFRGGSKETGPQEVMSNLRAIENSGNLRYDRIT